MLAWVLCFLDVSREQLYQRDSEFLKYQDSVLIHPQRTDNSSQNRLLNGSQWQSTGNDNQWCLHRQNVLSPKRISTQ